MKDTEINLKLINTKKTVNMRPSEKIQFILTEVKEGNVIVLEEGLTPEEESDLIEQTMIHINTEFTGIEIESYTQADTIDSPLERFISKLTGSVQTTPQIIGPADKVKTISKDTEHLKTKIN